MAKQILIESFDSKVEITKDKDGDIFFEGIFAIYDKPNLNNRIYPKKVMENAVYNFNENFVRQNRALGELDHPEESSVNLQKAAFIIKDELTLKEDGTVWGKAKILKNTPMGKIAYELLKEGVTIGVSSRGLGELQEKIEEGSDAIMEVSDYQLNCFDLVSEPSIGKYISVAEKKQDKNENNIDEVKNDKKDEIKESKKIDGLNLLKISEILFK